MVTSYRPPFPSLLLLFFCVCYALDDSPTGLRVRTLEVIDELETLIHMQQEKVLLLQELRDLEIRSLGEDQQEDGNTPTTNTAGSPRGRVLPAPLALRARVSLTRRRITSVACLFAKSLGRETLILVGTGSGHVDLVDRAGNVTGQVDTGHQSAVTHISSAGGHGSFFVTAGGDGTVRFFTVHRAQDESDSTLRFAIRPGSVIEDAAGRSMDASGNTVAHNTVTCLSTWSYGKKNWVAVGTSGDSIQIYSHRGQHEEEFLVGDSVTCMTRRLRLLAFVVGRTVRFLDLMTMKMEHVECTWGDAPLTSIAWIRSSPAVYAGTPEGSVVVFNPQSKEAEGIPTCAVSHTVDLHAGTRAVAHMDGIPGYLVVLAGNTLSFVNITAGHRWVPTLVEQQPVEVFVEEKGGGRIFLLIASLGGEILLAMEEGTLHRFRSTLPYHEGDRNLRTFYFLLIIGLVILVGYRLFRSQRKKEAKKRQEREEWAKQRTARRSQREYEPGVGYGPSNRHAAAMLHKRNVASDRNSGDTGGGVMTALERGAGLQQQQ